MTIAPIIPTARREAFDAPEWTFELKFDGFRAIADTVNGRMLSKRGNRMHRFEALLGSLPADCVLDGEIVALDGSGRPVFADLMFRRRAAAPRQRSLKPRVHESLPAAPPLRSPPCGNRSQNMPEPGQYVFAHKELVELMLKKADIHEGKWVLSVTFGFAAINGGPSPDQMVPTAVAGVQSIGVQRALPESPPSLTVDASEVNPAVAKTKRRKG